MSRRRSFVELLALKAVVPLFEQAGLLVRDLVRQRHERHLRTLEVDDAAAEDTEVSTPETDAP